jgi:predicted metal-dependent enzyme (double-stranded beta helix superfamily)
MEAIDRFARRMHAVLQEDLPDPERWQRVAALMPILLEDAELRRHASGWKDTNGDGYATTTNLLLYEDPRYGFVINALVKAEGGAVRPHDHAHTWTAYGVIEGTERVVRYEVIEGDRDGEHAVLRRSSDTLVTPGFVDVIGPYEAHAEIAEAGRTVAVIVRSQRVGIALHAVFDPQTGRVEHRPGPEQIPYAFN